MKKQFKQTLFWVIVFSISMAFLESAVVVYLREIYYPEGFSFPLTPIDPHLFVTEFGREIATLLMLLGIGFLTGKTPAQRFGYFLLSFAIWDIFYYVFLYILIAWPSSLLTWDILFLVPIPWVGPVLSPLIITVLMILLATSLIRNNRNLNRLQWILAVSGSLIVILSWTLDYWNFSSHKILQRNWEPFASSENYIPADFNWWIFGVGVLVISYSIANHTANFSFNRPSRSSKNRVV